MKQGRNREPNLRGDDVKLLQFELRQLKLKTPIVDPEDSSARRPSSPFRDFKNSTVLNRLGSLIRGPRDRLTSDLGSPFTLSLISN
jgi:hypothetical protein